MYTKNVQIMLFNLMLTGTYWTLGKSSRLIPCNRGKKECYFMDPTVRANFISRGKLPSPPSYLWTTSSISETPAALFILAKASSYMFSLSSSSSPSSSSPRSSMLLFWGSLVATWWNKIVIATIHGGSFVSTLSAQIFRDLARPLWNICTLQMDSHSQAACFN